MKTVYHITDREQLRERNSAEETSGSCLRKLLKGTSCAEVPTMLCLNHSLNLEQFTDVQRPCGFVSDLNDFEILSAKMLQDL